MPPLKAIEQAEFGGVDSRSNPVNLPIKRFLKMQNWVPRIDGHLQLREGYKLLEIDPSLADGGALHSLFAFIQPSTAARCLLFWQGTIPYVLNTRTMEVAAATIKGDAIASSERFQYALAKDGFIHMHNGTDKKFFDGSTLRDIGLPEPDADMLSQLTVVQGVRELSADEFDAIGLTLAPGGDFPTDDVGRYFYCAFYDLDAQEVGPATVAANQEDGPLLFVETTFDELQVTGLPNVNTPHPRWKKLLALTGDGDNIARFCVTSTKDITGGALVPITYTLSESSTSDDTTSFPTPSYDVALSDTDLSSPITATVSGAEQSISNSSTLAVTIHGLEQSITDLPGSPPPPPIYDSGSVSIDITGSNDYHHLFSVNYSKTSTRTSIANALKSAINASPYLSATVGGTGTNVITITTTVAGAGANYTAIVYSHTNDPTNFPPDVDGNSTSFWPTQSPSSGAFGDTTLYDTGTVTITVDDGTTTRDCTATYDQSSTPSSIALALAGSLNLIGLTASVSGAVITISAPTSGLELKIESDGHGFSVDDVVGFKGTGDAAFDGQIFTILAVDTAATPDTFTIFAPLAHGVPDHGQVQKLLAISASGTTATITSPVFYSEYEVNQNRGVAASTIGGAQPGYQLWASLYRPTPDGHVGNRVEIGQRIVPKDDASPPQPVRANLRVVGPMALDDSELTLLLGRTGDGAVVPYAMEDNDGNWITASSTSNALITSSDIDNNAELPTENDPPPAFVCFWREGDRLCGTIVNSAGAPQPFVYRSASEIDATTGIFVGDPAQAWSPARIETFPTAEGIIGGFGVMQESWCFTENDCAQLSEISGEVVWNGPFGPGFGIIGAFAMDKGWKGLPFWVTKDKQLCTMTPGSDGPIPISTEYEAALLRRIGDFENDPTDDNNHETATGTGTPQTATITPGNQNTLALFTSNADGATVPAGWTRLSGSRTFSQILFTDTPVTVSNPSTGVGAPSNEWANIIATIATDGTPAEVQHQNDSSVGYTRDITLSEDVTEGNAIIVAFSGNSPNPATGIPGVTDSQGNTYTVIEITNENSGYHVSAFLAYALNCAAGATTVSIGTTLEDGNADVWEFSGLLANIPIVDRVNFAEKTEVVYYRDPARNIEVLRIKCLDTGGLPFVVVHDFNLRDDASPLGQGYEEEFSGALREGDFTQCRVREGSGKSRVWAGGYDGNLYELYKGGLDDGNVFTADAISLRYFGGERTAVKTIEWYGDENIEWWITEEINPTGSPDVEGDWINVTTGMRAFPGDTGHAHWQADVDRPEMIHCYVWITLEAHPDDAPDPDDPMALSNTPHLPLETYGRLYLSAPILGDTRGR